MPSTVTRFARSTSAFRSAFESVGDSKVVLTAARMGASPRRAEARSSAATLATSAAMPSLPSLTRITPPCTVNVTELSRGVPKGASPSFSVASSTRNTIGAFRASNRPAIQRSEANRPRPFCITAVVVASTSMVIPAVLAATSIDRSLPASRTGS
ncbi:unannotated protein [freshwater metagenome]|uniref:Unannotated protein n=1 Tax=freshwater metagenome TaxID=449393 RepID=A0A6J6UZG0_9ZZZZ